MCVCIYLSIYTHTLYACYTYTHRCIVRMLTRECMRVGSPHETQMLPVTLVLATLGPILDTDEHKAL